MVGVAGGSRGCSTCRRRKIKCDLHAPVCGQCVRSRRQCSGPNLRTADYGQVRRSRWSGSPFDKTQNASRKCNSMEHKFVIVSATPDQLQIDSGEPLLVPFQNSQLLTSVMCPTSSSATSEYAWHYALRSSSSSTSDSAPVEEFLPGLDRALVGVDEPISPYVDDDSAECIICSRSAAMFAGPQLGSAYFQILLSSFMDQFCLMASTRFDGAVFDPWIASMPKFVSSTSPALTYASRAVVVGHFSRVRHNRDLQLWGTQLYVQALRHQNHEVSRFMIQSSPNDDLITTGLLLGLYEAIYCTTMDSWKRLMDGCLGLFQRRGPQAFKTGRSSVLFQSARTMLTVYNMTSKSHCFLSEPEWITTPFEMIPEKPPHQKLNDILLGIHRYLRVILIYRPRLYGRVNLSIEQRMNAAEAFFGLAKLKAKMDKWLIDYKRSVSGIDSDCLPDSVLYIEDYDKKCDPNATNEQWATTHFFKPPLIFASNAVANVIPLYYEALAIVQRGLCAVYDCALEFPCGHEELVTMPLEEFEKLSALRVARYNRLVCQSVQYVMGIQNAIGTANIVYPLRKAQVLLEDPLEKYYAFSMCEQLDKRFGLGISIMPLAQDGSENSKMVQQMLDLLPTCPHCGEKIRANGQETGSAKANVQFEYPSTDVVSG
ncbi:hypothetical protein V1517DRAFT_370602 [Lipomyces orientalis]|uniref:Uncharacterized protein n=1 Tax=Lipomyces orientalis TaxID=1233043 RepID=A0ACC3TZ70_9ASCO